MRILRPNHERHPLSEHIDADPAHTVRPAHRPTSVQIEKVTLQFVNDLGVTPVPGVCFKLLTESGETVAFWPAEYALGVARLLVQQATGLLVTGEMPDGSS